VNSAESEAILDAEYSGAAAPDTVIDFASCADTKTNFGGPSLGAAKAAPPFCERKNLPWSLSEGRLCSNLRES